MLIIQYETAATRGKVATARDKLKSNLRVLFYRFKYRKQSAAASEAIIRLVERNFEGKLM